MNDPRDVNGHFYRAVAMRERLDVPRVRRGGEMAVSLLLSKAHPARRAAGVPDDVAREAAVEVG